MMMAPVSPVAGGVAALVRGSDNTQCYQTRLTSEPGMLVLLQAAARPFDECEAPGTVRAVERFGNRRERRMYARCSRCHPCYRRGRWRSFKRFVKAARRIVDEGMAATGLSEREYAWRHMRMLTPTVRSGPYLEAGERYSGMHMAFRVAEMMAGLKKRLFKALPGCRLEYWTQLEPHGLGAQYRLHVHILLFNVPDHMMVWDGPGSDRRLHGAVSLEEWVQEIFDDRWKAPSSFARWLWRTGFWGASDCQRVKDWEGALEYVGKEMNTSDIEGDVSPGLLDWMFGNEATGRRIRCVRYSGGFYGVFDDREDSEVDRWQKHVPLFKEVRWSPGWSVDSIRLRDSEPPLTDDEVLTARTQHMRETFAWLRETSSESIERFLEKARAAGRAAERWRRARDWWLFEQRGRWREQLGELLGRLPSWLGVLRDEAGRLADEAREFRDWLGMPPWLSYQRRLLVGEMMDREARAPVS